MTNATLKLEQALQYMRCGARLVHAHGARNGSSCWFVIPGGAVTDSLADKVRERPDVVGEADGLFRSNLALGGLRAMNDRANNRRSIYKPSPPSHDQPPHIVRFEDFFSGASPTRGAPPRFGTFGR